MIVSQLSRLFVCFLEGLVATAPFTTLRPHANIGFVRVGIYPPPPLHPQSRCGRHASRPSHSAHAQWRVESESRKTSRRIPWHGPSQKNDVRKFATVEHDDALFPQSPEKILTFVLLVFHSRTLEMSLLFLSWSSSLRERSVQPKFLPHDRISSDYVEFRRLCWIPSHLTDVLALQITLNSVALMHLDQKSRSSSWCCQKGWSDCHTK